MSDHDAPAVGDSLTVHASGVTLHCRIERVTADGDTYHVRRADDGRLIVTGDRLGSMRVPPVASGC
jgi:hypothetical protein